MSPTGPNRGYLPDGFNHKDKPYYYRGSGWDPKTDKHFDITDRYPDAPVYNQLDTNSCVANATAAALWYVANNNPGKLSLDPSRHFIYYNARALAAMADGNDMKQWPTNVEDGGTQIRQAMKAISLLGVAAEDTDPWVVEDDKVLGCNDRPVDAAYLNARHTHPVEYCRLDPDHTEATERMFSDKEKESVGIMTLTRLKQSIQEGHPVVFGFNYYWKDFTIDDSASADAAKPENKGYATLKSLDGPHQPQPNSDWGGHAVLAVAWYDDEERVLCKNSWGKDKDSYPYFWMPYHWVTDFEATDDFWVIRTIDQSSGVPRATGPVLDSQVQATGKGWSISRFANMNEQDKASTAANSVISSVAYNSTITQAFWVSPSGAVLCKNFVGNASFMLVTSGSYIGSESTRLDGFEGGAVPGAIAAINWNEEQTTTFWVRPDGSIQCSFNGSVFQKLGILLSPPSGSGIFGMIRGANSASTKGGIAAVSRATNHQEMWYVTPEGAIEGLYYNFGSSTGWTWYELAPKGSADPASSLAAVTTPGNMFVFWISKDGELSGKRWADGGGQEGWRDTFAAGTFAPHSAAIRSRIAAVSRRSDTVDVYFITPKGVVETANWCQSQDSWARSKIDNSKNFPARVDSGLTAMRSNYNRTEVLWVSSNNSLVAASVMDGWGWKQTAVAGPGSVMGGSPLGTFWRDDARYSVIFQDYTGRLNVAEFWESGF